MSEDRSERGGLSVSAVLALAMLGALIFLAFKLLPPFIDNFRLQGEIENLARTATYSKVTEQEIQSEVIALAEDLGIYLDDSQVEVRKLRSSVDIVVQYNVPVNLVVRQVDLQFEPVAGNRNVTAR